jgi:hypothetical protein
MPWIGDVSSALVVSSAGWGNIIRDHVMQVFVNKAEMLATAVPKDGMFAFCVDTRITYVSVGGAWWVYSMPWRPFTGVLYTQPYAGGAITPGAGGTTGSMWWRQEMGNAKAIGSIASAVPSLSALFAIYFATPVMMQGAQQAGYARIYIPQTNRVSGGSGLWVDNGAATGASRCVVQEAGGGTTSVNTGVNITSGSPAISVDLNLDFMCDPTVDTP